MSLFPINTEQKNLLTVQVRSLEEQFLSGQDISSSMDTVQQLANDVNDLMKRLGMQYDPSGNPYLGLWNRSSFSEHPEYQELIQLYDTLGAIKWTYSGEVYSIYCHTLMGRPKPISLPCNATPRDLETAVSRVFGLAKGSFMMIQGGEDKSIVGRPPRYPENYPIMHKLRSSERLHVIMIKEGDLPKQPTHEDEKSAVNTAPSPSVVSPSEKELSQPAEGRGIKRKREEDPTTLRSTTVVKTPTESESVDRQKEDCLNQVSRFYEQFINGEDLSSFMNIIRRLAGEVDQLRNASTNREERDRLLIPKKELEDILLTDSPGTFIVGFRRVLDGKAGHVVLSHKTRLGELEDHIAEAFNIPKGSFAIRVNGVLYDNKKYPIIHKLYKGGEDVHVVDIKNS